MRTDLALKKSNANHIDYGFLSGLLPRGILPSNLDGIIVLDKATLYLEWKRPGEKLSCGQKRALITLAKEERNTVLIVYGESHPDKFYVMKIFKINPKTEKADEIGYGVNSLKKILILWSWENC